MGGGSRVRRNAKFEPFATFFTPPYLSLISLYRHAPVFVSHFTLPPRPRICLSFHFTATNPYLSLISLYRHTPVNFFDLSLLIFESPFFLFQVASYVSLALEEGGQLLCGGAPPPSQPIASHAAESGTSASNTASPEGAYLMPTLIGGLDPVKSRAATEEIFGPVLGLHLIPFSLSCSFF